jgi:hypothetical protein
VEKHIFVEISLQYCFLEMMLLFMGDCAGISGVLFDGDFVQNLGWKIERNLARKLTET